MSTRPFSNLSKVVYKRTYARNDGGIPENFSDTIERIIRGNTEGHNVTAQEVERLRYFMTERKAGPAGRGWWCSGSPAQKRFGGAALTNCWFLTGDDWANFVMAQDLLMLGGGVGYSVERQFIDSLPRIKKNVLITHKSTKDADFIIPDSREGWCELTRRTLEAFFVTGKGFNFSTVCIRPTGEPIGGFGGVASGPKPLIRMVEKLCGIFHSRAGHKLRSIDAADVMCSVGEMVVAGNVRRSAIIIIGDAHDKEFLKIKRWDLGPIPTQRAMANFSIMAEDPENDLRPLFWATYHHGEPLGIVNRHNIRNYGRGSANPKKDSAMGVNPCAEATLEDGEPCNLQEINLAAIESTQEFAEAARLMHRYGKRVTMEKYHWAKSDEVIKRNRRIGTGITGCLQNTALFNAKVLDYVYEQIQEENVSYSKELEIAESIRTTVIKPSGSQSKLLGAMAEGIHPAYSKYLIQRIRIASNDALIERLQKAGHYMEPVEKFDGTLDPETMVVDFYLETPDGCPIADEGFGTREQLDSLLLAQEHWADQAVSITVYYKEEDLPFIKEWVSDHLHRIKTISFLKHAGHGFKQAPKEPISREQFSELSSNIRPLDIEGVGDGELVSGIECDGGACPIR